MKKLSYNEQMKTNGGKKLCCYTFGYAGKKAPHVNAKKRTWHWDYYMGRCGVLYKYGH